MENNEKAEKLKKEVLDFALANGILEVVFREGEALELHNPKSVTITGTIDAPSRFIEGKAEEFEGAKTHCKVSKTDGKIELILNEQSETDRYTVIGKIDVAKKFVTLGINNDTKHYAPKELANKIKLMRKMFPSAIEHAKLCSSLRNIEAKVNQELKEADDRRGNVSIDFKQAVESNIPDEVEISLPLLEGEDPVKFKLAIVLEANGASEIRCYLESIDAAEMIETQFENRVEEEVEKIKEFSTVIYY